MSIELQKLFVFGVLVICTGAAVFMAGNKKDSR